MNRIQQKNLSDEELAVLAANGDDEAMAHLISAVTPIARAKASGFANARISNEDLMQEGMLGFLDAVKSFDPSKGVPFRAFAETCINNRIISAVRMNFNSKNAALSSAVSFEAESVEIASDSDPADIISDKFETEYLSQLLSTGLSDFEKKVIDLRLRGKSYAQVANELCCGEKAVDNAIQRIKSKMRRKLNK
jgi:RNA polymerase sporulation-specific sigma factor